MTFDLTAMVMANTDGLDALITRLTRLPALIEAYGERIAALARDLAPHRSGALRESIHSTLTGLVATISAGEGLPDIRAVAQEMGFTHVHSGTHVQNAYLLPALHAVLDEFIAAVQALMGGM